MMGIFLIEFGISGIFCETNFGAVTCKNISVRDDNQSMCVYLEHFRLVRLSLRLGDNV